MHILAVEYPGYGLYKQSKPDENKIKEDSEIVFDYIILVQYEPDAINPLAI